MSALMLRRRAMGKAPSSAFSPSDVPGQRLWLRAVDLALIDGDPVTTWTDQSSFAHSATQATAAAKPTFRTNILNAKPVVRFDGIDDYLQIANHSSLQPLLDPWTVIVVAKRLGNGGGDYPQIIGSRPWNAALDKGWAVCYGGTVAVGRLGPHFADGAAGHDVNGPLSTSVLSTTAFQAWELREDRATTEWYRNGALDVATNAADPTATIDQPNVVYIGREIEGSNTRIAHIDIAEIIIYGTLLTAAQRADLAGYFNSQYAI